MLQNSLMDILPRYQRLRIEIEKHLSDLQVGDKISTEGELMKKFGFSRVTVRKSLLELRRAGVLESFQGKGTFLAKKTKLSFHEEKKTKLLAVVVPSIVEYRDHARIVKGIESEAAKNGFRILLLQDGGIAEKQIENLQQIPRQDVEAVFIYPDGYITEQQAFLDAVTSLKKDQIPVIFLDRYVPEFDFPCVMTDNVRGMYIATEHLILSGSRRPALLGFWKNNPVHADRRKGYLAALRDYKLTPGLEKETGKKDYDAHAFEIVSAWIEEKKKLPFDSIVCMTDFIAHGAFLALKKAGLRVPEDIALVGYDHIDAELYQKMGLNLTSVKQPCEEIGAAAVRAFLEGGKKPLHTLLQPQLIIRTSCGEKTK
jgi:DNA-binding LacI/PurR family transcriptional regulator